MKNFNVQQFWALSYELKRLELVPRPLAPGDAKAWAMEVEMVMKLAEHQFKEYGFGDAAKLPMYSIGSELAKFNATLAYPIDIRPQLKALSQGVDVELGKQRFPHVPEEYAKYFEQEKLFGDLVFNKFEKARQDIKDAGNCLATGLPTACVFHLTRVAEIGLRHIAAKVGVRLIDKGKPQPVDYATWGKVIQGIRNKIADATKLPQGPRKARRLAFFSDAAEQCSYIKDLYRNEASHTRKRYAGNEALGAMQRIKGLMELLTGEPG